MSNSHNTQLENLMLRLSLKELEITSLGEQQEVLCAERSYLWRRIPMRVVTYESAHPVPTVSPQPDPQVLLDRIQLLQQDLKFKVLENQVLQDSIELRNLETRTYFSQGTQTPALPNYRCVIQQLELLNETLRGQTDPRTAAHAIRQLLRPQSSKFPEEKSIRELKEQLINLLGNAAYEVERVNLRGGERGGEHTLERHT